MEKKKVIHRLLQEKYKGTFGYKELGNNSFAYMDKSGDMRMIENGEETVDIICNAQDGKYHVYPRGPNLFWDLID